MATIRRVDRSIGLIIVYFLFTLFISASRPNAYLLFGAGFGSVMYDLVSQWQFTVISLFILTYILFDLHEIKTLPEFSPVLKIIPRFLLFTLVFFIGLHLLKYQTLNPIWIPSIINFGGFPVEVGSVNVIIWNTQVALSENLVMIMLATLFSLVGVSQGGYRYQGTFLGFIDWKVPDLNRLIAGIPACIYVGFMHIGTYVQNSSNVTVDIIFAAAFFYCFWILYITLGFGTDMAAHICYNLIL